MGFRISWLGVKTFDKDRLLAALGLQATSERLGDGWEYDTWASCADLPTGWTILVSNDFDFAAPEHLAAAAHDIPVLSCQVHEGIMYSVVRFWQQTGELWSVSHDAQEGVYDLSVTGSRPVELMAIRAALTKTQNEAGGESAGVDYIFDVPVVLAEALTGYRHDHGQFSWGEPVFMKVTRHS